MGLHGSVKRAGKVQASPPREVVAPGQAGVGTEAGNRTMSAELPAIR